MRMRADAPLLPLAVLFGVMPVVSAAPAPGEAQAKEELRAVLEATPDGARGAHLFAICTECHGPHAEGNASGWPPQIAAQHRRVIAKELVDYRAGLRWYDPMERIAGRHVLGSTQEVADVAAYVASLPPSADTTLGPERWAGKGAGIYVARCQWCHGVRGEGNDERFVPRVAGQQYEYLLRQLRDTIEARRPNMRSQHLRLIEACTMEELMGLAAYMSRLDRTTGP
ncbi:MAG TPA: c-type cytochrome [Steroidobacteraceae bacterium]|nr:c-type cytochrome [Steroidobacteraceae bacterium]